MEAKTEKNVYRMRIEQVREQMAQRGIDAYIVVSDDYHASEYVGEYFRCRAFLSGFTGSAGTLVILAEEAGLWTDGRYFIQAREQLEETGITLQKSGEEGVPTIPEYLNSHLKPGQCVGYDGRTIRVSYARMLQESLSGKEIRFAQTEDLITPIWTERPALPEKPIWLLEEKYTGKNRTQKLAELRSQMAARGVERHLLASLDDIAWLYNLRGDDIAYTPVALAYTLVDEEKAVLYISPQAVRGEVVRELEKDGIVLRPYLQVYEDVAKLEVGTSMLLDEDSVNVALRSAVPEGVRVIAAENPTMMAKAVKNPTEIENIRKAHIMDGVAVTRLIFWLKQCFARGEDTTENLTELTVCRKLESLRQESSSYLEQSFSPIAASGAHGAIVHYDPSQGQDASVERNTFLLLDTGGHYLEGTTDITRTIATGSLSQEQKRLYTAVLRGNLNLAAARFPYGCAGANLDPLARGPLWELGLDYRHGTGHGVGYLLNVHEGPNAIRLKEKDGTIGTVLEEGMLTSDEPGVYLEGRFGIRLENLILCRQTEKTEYGTFMRFETMTMVPFDREAILPEMMSERELARLNVYHAKVYETIAPYLSDEERAWLEEETRPL